jgi:hypothetical protein
VDPIAADIAAKLQDWKGLLCPVCSTTEFQLAVTQLERDVSEPTYRERYLIQCADGHVTRGPVVLHSAFHAKFVFTREYLRRLRGFRP